MKAPTERTRPSPADEVDPRGRYLYPGDVEDAMPEGNWARWLASYLQETILRLVVATAGGSAYANMPIYYRRGTRKHVSPDAFYLPGVPHDPSRRSYRLWETEVPPRVVFEILSRGSKNKDRVTNRQRYKEQGIQEYYWFDPDQGTLEALELDPETGAYQPRTPQSNGRYASFGLGLEVGVERGNIALYHEGQFVPPTEELLAEERRLRAEAERRLEAERRAREEAERLLARARERLRELGEQP